MIMSNKVIVLPLSDLRIRYNERINCDTIRVEQRYDQGFPFVDFFFICSKDRLINYFTSVLHLPLVSKGQQGHFHCNLSNLDLDVDVHVI